MRAGKAGCEVGAVAEGGAPLSCPLCGTRFRHGAPACGACPLSGGCDLVRCPACGYQFPRGSRLLEGLRRLWRSRGGGRDAA